MKKVDRQEAKSLWVDVAKVAPDEIQTETEVVLDAWVATEDAATSGDSIGAISNALINTSATKRVNTSIADKGGADYAPTWRRSESEALLMVLR